MKNIPAALPVITPNVSLPKHKKPLPPPKPTAPRHYYEDIDLCSSIDSKQMEVPNSLKCYAPNNKSAETTNGSLESTSKPHNTQEINLNNNDGIKEKLLEMEEKISQILLKLSQLESDVNYLKSRQQNMSLAIYKDTSPEQVQYF